MRKLIEMKNKRLANLGCYKSIVKSDNPNILMIKDVRKVYGKKSALKGINLNIKKGERVAILGANGAGKTTLLEIISQIRKPTSGSVTYNFSTLIDPRIKIGMQFQESKYPGNLRVIDVLRFYKSVYARNINAESINKLLKILGITSYLKKPIITRLSGGQKQRFNIFLALFYSPELLILDELSTGLDILSREKIMRFVNELVTENNHTLLLVSHQLDEIDYLTNRIIIIENGVVIIDKFKTEILKTWKSLSSFVHNYFLPKKRDKIWVHKIDKP